MGKQKLKRGFWRRPGSDIIQTRDPVTGQRTSTGCSDPSAAYMWHAERQRLSANPAYAASLAATVGGWVVKTLEHKAAQRTEATMHMYRVKLGHFVRLFGADAPLSTITPGAVDDYITTRRKEKAVNNTIARELTCLRQMLRLAKRAGQYAGDLDQVMPVGFSAEYKPVKRVLELADVPRLLAALQNDTERAWVAFALTFAADHGDVERATPADWHAEHRLMFVRGTKTNTRSAYLPVLPHVQDLFEFALPRLPVSWPRSSKGLGEACRRAGLPHLSPKDLRRSACTWLIEAGADEQFVSRFMRHASSAMVRRVYGQVRPAALESQLQAPALKLLAARAATITVPGEQVPESTEASQPEFSSENDDGEPEKHAWPLGGIGRRGGFKRRPGDRQSRRDSDSSEEDNVSSSCDVSRTVAKLGTFPSQRTDTDIGHSAASWALALAAEQLGLGGAS